jgi:hypothetical protein
MANEDISWETTGMTNVGVDVAMLSGRLAFTGDLYLNDTRGILLNLPIPRTLGLGGIAIALLVAFVARQARSSRRRSGFRA